MHSAKTLV